jgi:hypothetical protein
MCQIYDLYARCGHVYAYLYCAVYLWSSIHRLRRGALHGVLLNGSTLYQVGCLVFHNDQLASHGDVAMSVG